MVGTRGVFPKVYPHRLGRGERVKVCDGKFCCCVSEVVAADVGMTPQFVKSSAETQASPFIQERCDTTKQKAVVVIVLGTYIWYLGLCNGVE